jgi:hypothetical protein
MNAYTADAMLSNYILVIMLKIYVKWECDAQECGLCF